LLFEHQVHRVRHQAKILLPSGTRRIDMYSSPEDYGGMDKLIKIPAEDIDRMLAQWEDPSLFRFGTLDEVENYENLYQSIGVPELLPSDGWTIFHHIVTLARKRLQV
ncbi:hypothetical protein DFP72DRAFT_825746, partial [Ephemerocybe angulata]